jgi:hypothetical protein
MPFLLPPPEFRQGELSRMGLTGTCELQICRSAGPWSLGTPGKIEHSIQNAYLKGLLPRRSLLSRFFSHNNFIIRSYIRCRRLVLPIRLVRLVNPRGYG